ncbi:MAG: RNA-binding protein [Parafilimonas sp.]
MNIYVSNLGFHVGNEDLKGLFAAHGEVSSAKVITDRETSRSKGFGFVEMPNDAEGEEAIKKLNGFVVEGRSMNVNIARAKEQSGYKKSDNFWK